MAKRNFLIWILIGALLPNSMVLAAQEQAGSIRGVVRDKDFNAPLAAAQVLLVETGQKVVTSDQGNYLLPEVPPGKYTLVFAKDGYLRQVKSDVVVSAGRLTDLSISLAGDFTEMKEYVVQDILQFLPGSEASLLKLRFESPALMDSISSDLMSRAGASDAAGALRLVAGASVHDGKSAVIRGLPDRYVSSQLNGVRLPTADEDKRAVELDQFPSGVIESIQVSKTFTPDQQGDASGGAVNVRLKGIPDETTLQFGGEFGYNTQVTGRRDFLTYEGGGVNTWGDDADNREAQLDKLGESWLGAVGVTRGKAPADFKFTGSAGGQHEFDNGVKIGGFASLYYKRDSSFYDNGIDDSYWVTQPGHGLVPKTKQGVPQPDSDPPGAFGDFKTSLFNTTKGKESVQWSGLGTFGIEWDKHSLNLSYLETRIAEDTAILAEDTRGKAYFFPGYDPNDPQGTGNGSDDLDGAPYIRNETLSYTERTTRSLQLNGTHELAFEGFSLGSLFAFSEPELDWVVADSSAELDQPDKRQFGSYWHPDSYDPGTPPWTEPSTTPSIYYPYKPSDNINMGNLQRIWKGIEEESRQYAINLKLPFKQYSDDEGYVKFGLFDDRVDREFYQETFSNFGDSGAQFPGDWDDYWSGAFPGEDHPMTESLYDVDYDGELDISAYYGMVDYPLLSSLHLIGGARFESTDLSITNKPEELATWLPPGKIQSEELRPGSADVDFSRNDWLPSIGFVYDPLEQLTLRGSYSQTVARQTFKEVTPIKQQEFLGGDIFVGNPFLKMSDLKNYDLRLDYKPYEGGLFSLSYFKKDIKGPIEYVQQIASEFDFTTAVNYPKGKLDGYEVEMRQDLGWFLESMEGLSLGANATFIDATVRLTDDEIAGFAHTNIQAPMSRRDMTNAPEHLYNLFLTYDIDVSGTKAALFYTVQGDTLLAGAGQSDNNLIPSVYAKEYTSLNLSLSQKLGQYLTLKFSAKNLTDPSIDTVYRSPYIGADVPKTSFTKGVDYGLSLTAKFAF